MIDHADKSKVMIDLTQDDENENFEDDDEKKDVMIDHADKSKVMIDLTQDDENENFEDDDEEKDSSSVENTFIPSKRKYIKSQVFFALYN
jgi:hypothetical protein